MKFLILFLLISIEVNAADVLPIFPIADSSGNGITSTLVSGKQAVDVNAVSIGPDASTATNQSTLNTRVGDLTEAAPASDTASSGLNGRLQRIAQRLTTLIAFYAADFGLSSGSIRTAAQVGNSSGAADFNSGSTSAQTLRSASNIYGIVQTSAPSAGTNATIKQVTLDAYGKQVISQAEAINTEWGQMFSSSTNSQTLSGTTEVAFMLFQNPNASGKTAKIYRISFGPTLGNNYVTYRVYIDPTVTSTGTPITEVGMRQTNQATNVTNTFFAPTVSANGSFLTVYTTSGLSGIGRDLMYNFSLWIEANHSLLITRQLSANATVSGVNMEWAEQ